MSETNPTNYVLENDSSVSGIFIGEATIIEARSVSNEDIYKNGKPVDVGIEFKLDIGKDFYPLFNVAGNFKVVDGKVTASTTTTVKIALQRLKVKWDKLNPDNSIPQSVLDQCIGKKIVRLQYPYAKNEETGKAKYRTFKQFYLADVADAKMKLKAEYEKSVAGGYTKPLDEALSFPPTDAEVAEVEPAHNF